MHGGSPSLHKSEIRMSLKTLLKTGPTCENTAAVDESNLNDFIILMYRINRLSIQNLFPKSKL